MINNLFSVFDPSSTTFSLAWIIALLALMLVNPNLWNISQTSENVNMYLVENLNNEVSFSLGSTENGLELMIISIFLSIALINILALYPQNFSITSHLAVTLPIALIFWLSIILIGWTLHTSHILSHLVPQGTPGVLMPFMVLIELTSNLIRPITLCVRLTANLIAGHLLITLLGNALINTGPLLIIPSIIIPITLTILESAVACIQAYVFITLITLYVTEAN